LAGLQFGAQGGIGAIDFIAGSPPCWHPGIERASDHGPGQLRFGGELDVFGYSGSGAPGRVAGPGFREVQLPVDHRVPSLPRIGQIHCDLGVLHPTRGTGVLALHPDRRGALLDIPGFINHQHRVRITQVLGDVVTQIIAHSIGIPHRAAQQVLHAIRRCITSMLGG
jgi:hypothetical protein